MSSRSRPQSVLLALLGLGLLATVPAANAAPACVGNEVPVSWPNVNPTWEFCYLPPSQSSGPRGSGLELRNVFLHGRLVLKRAHAPMLFAEYTTSTCYRDWKNDDSPQITWASVHPTYQRTTTSSCDRSQSPASSYGSCPFGLTINGSGGAPIGTCGNTVVVEDRGDHVEISTSYEAAWYKYSSRFRFYTDGSFEPEFGFGNSDGTNNGITHWHHNYWRLDFDIEGAANDVIRENNIVQATEFATLRCNANTIPACTTGERRWQITDTVTQRGFQLMPTSDDYVTPTNQSGRNLHLRDVIGTIYNANEVSDQPTEGTGDCTANHGALANGGDLDGAAGAGTDVVLYYRAGVRDKTTPPLPYLYADGLENLPAGQDSMVCKKVGPVFTPIGDWN